MPDPFSEARARKIDPHGVLRTYQGWPSLARKGFAVSTRIPPGKFSKGYVLGMGGSAAGGDILASWLAGRAGAEVAVFKGQLPIGDLSGTLAIACSASGKTEETISMMKTAVDRGATVVSLSAGGRLVGVSKRLGVPHIAMPEVVAPRYMLPFIVFSCLSVFNRAMDLDCETEAEDAFQEMESESAALAIGLPPAENEAKALALRVLKRTPAVYGSRITRGVGIRFKNVLNENSKKHAHFDGLPDAFHNEIEAWEDPSIENLPIFLRHTEESAWDRSRTDSMVKILEDLGKGPVQVRGRGSSSLAQLMTMAYRLDMVSYYVALGLGRDPLPTKLIDRLKRET
ncbi:MAG: hypothetical protein HY297_03375 [Thaumarchaeota archaeon]|nr:hypothetical protein [Nitrososphaerota archaeon]